MNIHKQSSVVIGLEVYFQVQPIFGYGTQRSHKRTKYYTHPSLKKLNTLEILRCEKIKVMITFVKRSLNQFCDRS